MIQKGKKHVSLILKNIWLDYKGGIWQAMVIYFKDRRAEIQKYSLEDIWMN